MRKFKKSAIVVGALSLLIPAITLAHGVNTMGMGKMGGMAAAGTVTSISGNTITLTGKNGTIYTIDASKAQVEKVAVGAVGVKPTPTTIAVSAIQNGDTLLVLGTVNGNNIAATKIIDGAFEGKGLFMGKNLFGGTVASISGNTITLSAKNKTTYTVDATNAKILKLFAGVNGARATTTAISISDVKAGDSLRVMGTLTGNNIAATNIVDGSFPVKNFQGKGIHKGFFNKARAK